MNGRLSCDTRFVGKPSGFSWTERKNGDVVIRHNGREATTLRGSAAADFRIDVTGGADDAAQEVMARVTGNYKRGNERQARRHPRNH